MVAPTVPDDEYIDILGLQSLEPEKYAGAVEQFTSVPCESMISGFVSCDTVRAIQW